MNLSETTYTNLDDRTDLDMAELDWDRMWADEEELRMLDAENYLRAYWNGDL